MSPTLSTSLLVVFLSDTLAGKVCDTGLPHDTCKLNGQGCEYKMVNFEPLQLTVWKWDEEKKGYEDAPSGHLEAHGLQGGERDWQMYLHGPMLRPAREQGQWDMPPFYVGATWTNSLYRFENITRQGRGQPLTAVQKMVSKVVAPSTSVAIEDASGEMAGMLVAEGQPFWLSEPEDPEHMEFNFGGVEYVSDEEQHCQKIFPNKLDKSGSFFTDSDVVNTVSCHKDTNTCFFTVWRFFDDSAVMHNPLIKWLMPDCLHYCVLEGLDPESVKKGCQKAGIVHYENGEAVCSKEGVGAVHGMTVAHTHKDDPSVFDIFLVMTGGATFVGGESSMRKVVCQKTADGDLKVLSHEAFAKDVFDLMVNRSSETGIAPVDAGGDHAWPDDSGKYLWISTFRYGNAGVHMVDYDTGKLIYSVHGMDNYIPGNYAYSAGIHGAGTFDQRGSTLLVATSACTQPKTACAPLPYNKFTKAMNLEAKGIMYIVDLGELLPLADGHAAKEVHI